MRLGLLEYILQTTDCSFSLENRDWFMGVPGARTHLEYAPNSFPPERSPDDSLYTRGGQVLGAHPAYELAPLSGPAE